MISVANKKKKEDKIRQKICTQLTSKPSASGRNPRSACDVWKKRMSSPLGTETWSTIMTESFSCIHIQTDFMTVNSLMVKQTQSQSNRWRWRCLLWYVLHYELWMMNHKDSILLQFSLGLVTTKFIDTKSLSREPGGYKCKTAIWDIYNLCALDAVICKKLQRNFNGLEAEKGRKKSLSWLFAPFFSVNHFYTKRKIKSFWYLTNSAIEPVITEKKGISSFYFNALLISWLGSHELHSEAWAVAGNAVRFGQQRHIISIDQCPSTQNRWRLIIHFSNNPTVN